MARTQEQIDAALDYLATRVQSVPTQEQISTLTDTLTTQHVELLTLVAALTARIQALEDWKLVHEQDVNAHST